MGWFPEMETQGWQEYYRRRREEEVKSYVEYLQGKAKQDFLDFVAETEQEKQKAVTAPQA